jgi:hypothetical protein
MATDTNTLNYEGELQNVQIDPRGITYQADSTALNPLGCLHRHGGNVYRYVLLTTGDGPVATVYGAPAYWYQLTPYSNGAAAPLFTVTSDFSYGLGANAVAGAFIKAAITTGSYIWIQVAGIIDAYVSGSTVAGSRQMGGADGVWTLSSSNAENECFGVSLEADATQVAATEIINCYW